LREPFGFIAEMARFTSGGGSPNGANFADHSGWLGFLDAFRTLCVDPTTEFSALLEEVRISGVPDR
jgi:hypothetical protein